MTYLAEADDIEEMEHNLPEGEAILWQGSADRALLSRRVFHWRKVAIYFGLLLVWRLMTATDGSQAMGAAAGSVINLMLAGVVAVGLLQLLGFLIARSTTYTITSQRVLLRFGVALPMSVNLPFTQIRDAGVRLAKDGSGDLCFKTVPGQRVSFFLMWPHVRPGHLLSPQPSLRCLTNVQEVAELFRTAIEATADGRNLVGENASAGNPRARSDSPTDRPDGLPDDLPLALAGH